MNRRDDLNGLDLNHKLLLDKEINPVPDARKFDTIVDQRNRNFLEDRKPNFVELIGRQA